MRRRNFLTGSAAAALGAGLASLPVWAAGGRQAPDIRGDGTWLNSGALSMAGLRGKVVLVDFWTHRCFNCINTLPRVTRLYNTYKDQGFVVVGVHTPEFAVEKVTANIEAAISRFGIRYPVVRDNDFATWNAWGNRFWPAQYIVDQSGRIVYTHEGEGGYDEMEQLVKKLLANG